MIKSVNQQDKCEITNSVHNHKINGNCGLPCHELGVRPISIPSPHQEAWAERFDKKYSGYLETSSSMGIGGSEEVKSFIRQELTTLHKADCERFRGMLEELVVAALFNNDLEWTRIHEMIKMRAPISVRNKEYYEKPFTDIRTALQKFEEEKV